MSNCVLVNWGIDNLLTALAASTAIIRLLFMVARGEVPVHQLLIWRLSSLIIFVLAILIASQRHFRWFSGGAEPSGLVLGFQCGLITWKYVLGNPSMRTLKLPYNKTGNSVAMETTEISYHNMCCSSMHLYLLTVDPYIIAKEFLTVNNLPAWYFDEVRGG